MLENKLVSQEQLLSCFVCINWEILLRDLKNNVVEVNKSYNKI